MRALNAIGHGVATTSSRLVVVALGIVIGLGVPVGWIWVGSQIQTTTAPSWTALAVVHVGMISTLLVVAFLLSFLVARDKRRRRTRSRSDWMRGMTEARKTSSISDVHPLELVIFLAVFIDIIVFVVWFFAFADPGTPVGQG